jgi:exopolysaccharide biosynthesis polyprenyl glycosylphosphotransferase
MAATSTFTVEDDVATNGEGMPVGARPLSADVARWRRTLPLILLSSDATAVLVGATVATVALYGTDPPHLPIGRLSLVWWAVGLVVIPIWLATLTLAGGYQGKLLGAGNDEYRLVIAGGTYSLAIIATLLFLFRIDFRRAWVGIMLPTALALTILFRHLVRRALHRGRRGGRWMRRVALYGTASSAHAVAQHMHKNPWSGLDVVGACVVDRQLIAGNGLAVLGGPADLTRVIAAEQIDTVAVTSEIGPGRLRSLAWSLRGTGIDLLVVPSITDVAGPRIAIRPIGGLPLLHVEEPELDWVSRIAKNTFDRAGSAVALLVLSPLLLLVAMAIKLTSPGPVFYRQRRVGRDGSEFQMMKFRTMVVDADQHVEELRSENEAEGPLFKIHNDPRVTPVGKQLRRFSIDELPQLVHVLRGTMSFVGPRPPLPSEVASYDDTVRRRLMVKPGLTGLWQVSGRSDLSWEDSIRLDLFYIDHWSIAMDLTIMLKTVSAVLRARGAY